MKNFFISVKNVLSKFVRKNKEVIDVVKDKVETLVIKQDPARLKLGDFVFKLFTKDSIPSSYGVVVFRDKLTNRMEIGRSVQLPEYLSSITPEAMKEGKFGRGPRSMSDVELFYIEVETKEDVLKTYNQINKLIYKKL